MKKITYILFIATLALASCNTENENSLKEKEHEGGHNEEKSVLLNIQQQKALGLKTGGFVMRNITTTVKVNGRLEVAPGSRAGVTAVVGGNVKKIEVFEGDKVRKGEILAILEHPVYVTLQEEFATTANNLEFLKQEYERQKELFENNIGAGRDFQKAKTDYNNAKIKYESLKLRLLLLNLSPEQVKNGKISGNVKITAPVTGFVASVNVTVGVYVDAKTKMFEIINNDHIHADFEVYENDAGLLKTGQKIHFTVSNNKDKEYSASVFAIGKQFEEITKTVHIHANIDNKTDDLIPGMYISGHLHTDGLFVKTLPDEAIVKEGTKSYIFIVDNDESLYSDKTSLQNQKSGKVNGNIRLKPVEIIAGQSDEGYTEVKLLKELPPDTRIALNSAYYLFADLTKEETGHEH